MVKENAHFDSMDYAGRPGANHRKSLEWIWRWLTDDQSMGRVPHLATELAHDSPHWRRVASVELLILGCHEKSIIFKRLDEMLHVFHPPGRIDAYHVSDYTIAHVWTDIRPWVSFQVDYYRHIAAVRPTAA
jgi:hypothetical protein